MTKRRVIGLVLALGLAASLSACSAEMSTEAAGKKYLETICPINNSILDVTAAGQANDFASFKAAAAKTRDASQKAAKVFEDTSIVWPAGMTPLLSRARANTIDYVSYYNQLALSSSFNDAGSKSKPSVDSNVGQEIRIKLNLPADTTASCAAFK